MRGESAESLEDAAQQMVRLRRGSSLKQLLCCRSAGSPVLPLRQRESPPALADPAPSHLARSSLSSRSSRSK